MISFYAPVVIISIVEATTISIAFITEMELKWRLTTAAPRLANHS